MSEVQYVHLSQLTEKTNVGTKAQNLHQLMKLGYRVPETIVIPYESFKACKSDSKTGFACIEKLLESIIDEGKYYSVRSSANVEDSSQFSFAGQFETYLHLKGLTSIMEAVESTWNSSNSEHADAYLSGLAHTVSNLEMAVIIQEMVIAKISGVVFTRNPITGLDEVIVETVDGYGDALVQEGVTPDRWVHKWGNWTEQPTMKPEREPLISTVIEMSKNIADAVGHPVDLEWAHDGNEIYWLQMRKITTLENTNIYSNRISRGFLPGIILPLVWSINITVVNSSWKRLFIELLGPIAHNIDINNLAKSFYYRAYFNMGVIGDIFEVLGMPREALEILAGIESPEEGRPSFKPGSRTMRYLPRMLSTVVRKLFFSKQIELYLRGKTEYYRKTAGIDMDSLDETATLAVIESLMAENTDASYYVIISQLLNSIYNRLYRGQLEKFGLDSDLLEFKETRERLRHINPNHHLGLLHMEYLHLDSGQQNMLKELTLEKAFLTPELGSFRVSLREFTQRFGHLSNSGNDFSKPTWREDPTLILKMVTDLGSIQEKDSLEQAKLESALTQNRMLRTFYSNAAKYGEYRESVNFLYTFGYGLFRRFFKNLERLLLRRELLENEDDIFLMTYDEVKSLIDEPSQGSILRQKISQRKEEIERYRDISLPEVIYNELPESALIQGRVLRNLQGVATSRGHTVGPARVVHGPSDFDKIQEGDVLVIPFSDVSWTPMFSRASAVVSESGGILSHCSIVAREYCIPAVVSVQGIMDLPDGTVISVDGYRGEVQVMEEK